MTRAPWNRRRHFPRCAACHHRPALLVSKYCSDCLRDFPMLATLEPRAQQLDLFHKART
jgi:hypothetical protein